MIFRNAGCGAPAKITCSYPPKEDHVMKNIVLASWAAFLLSILAAADVALADDTFILATGRRDPRIYAIDFRAALKRHNNNTPNAIVSRSKVHPDRLDGTPVGDPANIVLSEDRRTAYVINHHGPVNNAEFLQHGGRGSVSGMNGREMLDPGSDNTDRAVEHNYDSGYFRAVGLLVLPHLLLLSHPENWLTRDGSNRINPIDRNTGGPPRQIEIAPRIPVQTGPFGIKASPNGKFIAVTARESGQADFEGNTISIIDVDRARAGAPGAEAARVRVGTDDPNGQTRPFTVAWTPDGRQIILANFRSNNASIMDLRLALAHDPRAEVARIPVIRPPETDGSVLPGRPKGTAVTSDGRYAVVSGGPRLAPDVPPSGTVWVIDLHARAVVATVTGVGNDPYVLAILEDGPD